MKEGVLMENTQSGTVEYLWDVNMKQTCSQHGGFVGVFMTMEPEKEKKRILLVLSVWLQRYLDSVTHME